MWEQITLRQYLQLYDIEQNKNLTELDKQIKMLCTIDNKKEEDYDTIKYKDFLLLVKKMVDELSVIPDCKAVDVIEVNGNKYKFVHDISEITAGQFIDFNGYCTDVMNLNKTAASFFLAMKGKRVCKYGEVPHEKVAEDLLSARFIDIQGCLLFFYHVVTESILNMQTYSTGMEALIKNKISNSLNIGDGNITLN
jgi:hypothetical protein